MGLFDELNDQPTIGNDLEDFEAGLNKDPVPSQQTLEEYQIAQQFAVNEAIDSPETISLKRQGAALATEILISGGGQVTGAVASGGSSLTGVGIAAAPFVWIGTTFSTGYAGNVAAQAIEDPNGVKEFSHGRAIAAGLINTIPFVGKFTKGSKATRIAKAIAAQGAQGGVMAAGDTTIRLAIDEQRLPTIGELGVATGYGIGVGTILGGGIEGAKPVIKKMTPSVKRFFGKIAGKTPEEIDAMIKKGELLPEEVEDAMEEISKDPNAKPDAPEQPIYKIPEEDIGDVHTRSLRELAEDVDPKHLQNHVDRLATHPEIVAMRQRASDAGQSTLDKAGGKFDDNWQTERGWLAKVDELYGTGAPRKERKALIIAGGTASGKSTLADQDADALGAKIIDSDYAKELLPEYDGGNGAGLVHHESKAINGLVLERALDNGDNIILPIVGSSGGSIKKTIALLKAEGYEVAFKYVDVPEAVAQARNFKRIYRTGRFVDPDYVTDQYKKIAKNYESGKSNSSHSQRVTNENDTIEILEQGGNWKDFFNSGDVLTGRPVRGDSDRGANEQATSSSQQGRVTPPNQQAVRAAIDEVDSILVNQTDGNAYNVTKKVKAVFTAASEELQKDIRELIKTGDIEIAKRLLARLPNYIELDRKVSKKDFAQATGLKANDKNAKLGAERLKAGITATNNQRTLNLRRLGEMLEELIEDGVPIRDKDVKGLQAENKRKASGTRLTKEERLDEIQSHLLETFTKERSGTLQKVMDAYFSVRLVQLLNSFKTATVGTVSAVAQTALRPAVNTVVNTRKLLSNPKLKDKTIGQKTRYVMSDVIATQEYLYTVTKHLANTMRSVGNTIKNRGESAFLHLDKHSYVQGEINAAKSITRSEQAGFNRAKRRNDARVQADGTMKTALQIKAKVLNNPIVRAPLFFYDYGLALIGGFEEISLIAHSLRSQRAKGIKKGIEEGADDIGKYADDYVESSIDRTSGTFKAKYDAGFAEDFNVARKDHFRRLDIDPDDIRQKGQWDESVINTLQKMSNNPDEVGMLIKILYPILGVPLRATGYAAKYVPPVALYRLGMKAVGRGVSALEKKTGDKLATYGKYNRSIAEAEADIKLARKQIEDPLSTADEIKDAKNLITDKEAEAARVRGYQADDDAEALAFASIGFAFFIHSYMSAKQGEITGTMAMYDDDQKKALYAGQGAQQAYRMNLFGEERDFRYADPIKLAMALGADWAHRQELADNKMLRDDQKGLKGLIGFTSNFVKAMITEMPTSRGIKNLSGVFSGDPDKQLKGVSDSFQSLVPVPSEIRRARTADDEFVSDRTQGNVLGNAVDQALGKEAANYRLTWLGEPKKRDADTVSGYFFTMGAKKPVELEPIDKVYLSDSLLQQTISHTPTTINKLALKEYMNEDGESLYSLYGRLVSTTKLGGMTLRQRLNSLVSDPNWKSRFALGYDDDPKTGQETNIAIEQVKEILSKYRAHAKKQILKTSVAQDYYKDGSNIYSEMEQRKNINSSSTNILEVLNIE